VPGLVISAAVVALASLLATQQIGGVVARLVLLTALCAAPIAIAMMVNRVLTTFLALVLVNLVLRRVRERRRRTETVAVAA
jgi:hypothetical protein